MPRLEERPVVIPSTDGISLQGALHAVDQPRFAAVVLHPHPQYGGDMDNHVVMAICSALAEREAATLRLNFRGTGRSGGSHDGGRAEQDDAHAAIALVRDEFGEVPLVLAGYSFGAQVAAAACDRARPAALVLVSPPLAYGRLAEVTSRIPVLAVAGDRDPVCPEGLLRRLERDQVVIRVVPGVEHSWFGGLEQLTAIIASFEFNFRVQ